MTTHFVRVMAGSAAGDINLQLLLQNRNYCKVTKDLGQGCNGAVQAMATSFLPGAVFKKAGSVSDIQHEAGVWGLRQVQHPSIVAAYGTMWGPKQPNGSQHLYLAMERLSFSLLDRISDKT